MKVACPWMTSPPEGRAIKEFHAVRQEKKSLCGLSKSLTFNAHNPPILLNSRYAHEEALGLFESRPEIK
jgi:hypothetical protein